MPYFLDSWSREAKDGHTSEKPFTEEIESIKHGYYLAFDDETFEQALASCGHPDKSENSAYRSGLSFIREGEIESFQIYNETGEIVSRFNRGAA